MNLNAIANSIIVAVNPNIQATLRSNQGYVEADDGSQVPSYLESEVTVQVQSLTANDLMHLDNMTQQGEYNSVYINGVLDGQRRSLGKGEDQLVFVPQGESVATAWRIVKVDERYSGLWTKVIVCRQ